MNDLKYDIAMDELESMGYTLESAEDYLNGNGILEFIEEPVREEPLTLKEAFELRFGKEISE